MQLSFLPEPYPHLSRHLVDGVLSDEGVQLFRTLIYAFYQKEGRSFAWRTTHDPYHIVVSEVMLQQTQTQRVQGKFEQFIEAFPMLSALAAAPFAQVLAYWQGLGYNRRARALHLFAQRVVQEYQGVIPTTSEELVTFQGIGPATAASIAAFAFNAPAVFVETNIRTVFIHTFFHEHEDAVPDSLILPLVAATLDRTQPRLWYYALMDYGVALKKAFPNPSRRSAHYAKQSRFEGSDRQLRGKILKVLCERSSASFQELCRVLGAQQDIPRVQKIVQALAAEKFIAKQGKRWALIH
jgi:A/G-specific adenine glycosylase